MAIASSFAEILPLGTAGVGTYSAPVLPTGVKCVLTHGEANYQFFTEVFRHYMALQPKVQSKNFAA